MKRIAFLLIVLAAAAGGFAAKAALENDVIAAFFRDYAVWIGVLAVSGLLLLGVTLATGYLYARHRLRKLLKADEPLTEAQIAEGLVDMLTTPDGVTNPTPQDRQRAALVNAGTLLMRRQATQFYFNVTVTVMGGLIGATTLFLLYEQNQKITLQTDANITESVLLEGARRAALSSEMANLFEAIRKEAAEEKTDCTENAHEDPDRWTNCLFILPDTQRKIVFLSPDLDERVRSFARRNTPYRIAVSNGGELDFELPLRNQLDFPNLSPQRGQLLETLVLNNVFTGYFDLSSSQLSSTDLRGRSFARAVLVGADMSDANLNKTEFYRARLREANLSWAQMYASDFRSANMPEAKLHGAQAEEARFDGAILLQADLGGANFNRASFISAEMADVYLGGAELEGANLSGAILIDAYLRGANLSSSNLSGTVMTGVVTDETTVWSSAWAWRDSPPVGLPEDISVTHCDFDPSRHTRIERPKDCEGLPN